MFCFLPNTALGRNYCLLHFLLSQWHSEVWKTPGFLFQSPLPSRVCQTQIVQEVNLHFGSSPTLLGGLKHALKKYVKTDTPLYFVSPSCIFLVLFLHHTKNLSVFWFCAFPTKLMFETTTLHPRHF